VPQLTNITYTLSLSSDPLTGPFTTSVTVSLGTVISIRLNQLTAGPVSIVNVSFGDGTPEQNFTIVVGSYVNLTKNYSTTGTYTISADPVTVSLSIPVCINNVTVNVVSWSNYIIVYHFKIENVFTFKKLACYVLIQQQQLQQLAHHRRPLPNRLVNTHFPKRQCHKINK
jgi:hypothetical protein